MVSFWLLLWVTCYSVVLESANFFHQSFNLYENGALHPHPRPSVSRRHPPHCSSEPAARPPQPGHRAPARATGWGHRSGCGNPATVRIESPADSHLRQREHRPRRGGRGWSAGRRVRCVLESPLVDLEVAGPQVAGFAGIEKGSSCPQKRCLLTRPGRSSRARGTEDALRGSTTEVRGEARLGGQVRIGGERIGEKGQTRRRHTL